MLRPHLKRMLPTTIRSFTTTTTPPPAPLAGKTCLITGGSSGIGLGIARRFLAADAGATRVILLSRGKEKLRDALGQLGTGRRDGEDKEVAEVAWDDGVGSPSAIARRGRVTLIAGDVGRDEVWRDRRVVSLMVWYGRVAREKREKKSEGAFGGGGVKLALTDSSAGGGC